MAWWFDSATDLLWRNALGAIPLALLAVAFCRWVPTRPATRHAVWLMILLVLVAPPVLPVWAPGDSTADSGDPGASGRPDALLADLAALDPLASPAPNDAGAILADAAIGPLAAPAADEYATCPSRTRPEFRVPERLAPAPDSVGRFLASDDEGHRPQPVPGLATPANDTVVAADRADEPPVLLTTPAEGAPADAVLQQSHDALSRKAHPLQAAVAGLARIAAVRDAMGAVIGRSPLPAGVWLIGIAAVLLAAAARAVRFARRIRAAVPAPPAVTEMVNRAAAAVGLRRVPQTLTVRDHVSPMIWCPPLTKRTCLILPTALWSELDDVGRRAVLLHELAHLKRRDHWVRWVEVVVGGLYWWNPLVWWIRRRLQQEAELCCDAWVTWLLPRGRRAYAEALLRTNEYVCQDAATMPEVGIAVTTGRARRLARRLTMIMTASTKPRLSVSGIGLALTLAAVGWFATPAWSGPPEPSASDGAPSAVVANDEFDIRLEGGVMLVGGGEERGKSSRDDVADRLDRLEKKMQKLAEKLDKMAGSAYGWSQPIPAPEPKGPERVITPGVPAPPLMDQMKGEQMVRAYRLAPEKLTLLTALLVRQDVPLLVEPGEDEIKVHGTKAQHAAFQHFVDLIDPGKEKQVKAYYLPEGKLEALNALMVLKEVPVLVEPGKDAIKVHGTSLEQSVFAAFVELIQPQAGKEAGGRTVGLEEVLRSDQAADEYKKAIEKKTKEDKHRAEQEAKSVKSSTRENEEALKLAAEAEQHAVEIEEDTKLAEADTSV
ncbi:MAG TPA: M56 family metallopeptidase [Phycisphaerae bacterium]|nr:M56 family metallopeptidase [Phycisphaerae bacterium]